MRLIVLTLLVLLNFCFGLHFYMDTHDRKCFLEEVPADTLVSGKYRAEELNPSTKEWTTSTDVGINIQVEETEEKHAVVNSRGPSVGTFVFTSHLAGDHTVCLSTNTTSSWFQGNPTLRIHLDIAIGSIKHDEGEDLNHIQNLTNRIRDLNGKLQDIRKEQQFQREREVKFRDLSEITNTSSVKWSIIQMIVISLGCYWQSTHLRAFFNEKKLR